MPRLPVLSFLSSARRHALIAALLALAGCSGDYSGGTAGGDGGGEPPVADAGGSAGGGAGDGGDGMADLVDGRTQYDAQCRSCHGPTGQGGVGPAMTAPTCPSCASTDTLIARIHGTMPMGNPAACRDDCARDVAHYILAGFTTEVAGGGGGGGGGGDDDGDSDSDGGDGTDGDDGDDGSGGTPARDATCAVTMRFQSNWNTGFVTEVVIRNFSGAPVDGWEVRFRFADGQRVTNHWNTELTQSGADVRARNAGYNATIADGSEVSFGFQGEHDGANTLPTDIALVADGCVLAGDDGAGSGGADDGGVPDPPDDGEPLVCADRPPAPRTLRLLTRREYDRTIRDLTGLDGRFTDDFPVEARVRGYDNNADVAVVTSRHIDAYLAAGAAVAERAVAERRAALLGDCSSGEACLHAFIDRFGRRAFRRPLTATERDTYRALDRDALTDGDFDTAVRMVIRAMLASPHFLYRAELGNAAGSFHVLDGYETATAMAYLLWGSMPDDALLDAAAAGDLASAAGRRDAAERMLADPRAREQIADFAGQWTGAYRILEQFKDPDIYPRFDDDVREAMAEELARFVNHVFLDVPDGSFRELHTADYVFLNGALRAFYRQPGATGDAAFARQPVADGTRGGLLALGAVVASHAHSNESSPIKRGVFVRERLLCQELPDPPQDVDTTPPGLDPDLTTRERFAQHTDDPNCASCHQYIDGVGFGFERYDGVGDYRDRENGLAVDASGEVVDIEGFRTGTSDPFAGPRELGALLADSPAAQDCAVRQYYRYARGYEEGAADQCTLDALTASFRDGGLVLRDLILDHIAHPSFVRRRAGGDA